MTSGIVCRTKSAIFSCGFRRVVVETAIDYIGVTRSRRPVILAAVQPEDIPAC